MLEKIKKLCKEQGKTLASLEKECGLGNGTISKWGRNSPSVDKVSAVAKILNVSISEILGEKKNPVSANGDGISEHDVRLLEWFHSLPEEKRRAILEIAGGPKE